MVIVPSRASARKVRRRRTILLQCLIALGGLLYTMGAIVYAAKRPNLAPNRFGFHELFHLFVVAAAAAHYAAVAAFLAPL